jgi:putative addiction module component (TIGR02574 family)
MTPTLESLGIDKLTDDEKYELVEAILDTISKSADSIELTDEQKRELDHRAAEHEADPSTAIPWEEAEARLFEPYRQ